VMARGWEPRRKLPNKLTAQVMRQAPAQQEGPSDAS
jgi:hypothetical protein